MQSVFIIIDDSIEVRDILIQLKKHLEKDLSKIKAGKTGFIILEQHNFKQLSEFYYN
jgi:hypothetical protein